MSGEASRAKELLLTGILFAAGFVAGCNSSIQPPRPGATDAVRSTGVDRRPASQLSSRDAAGEPYDYYVLNLSWSPEYCHRNPMAAECKQHLGFVVHGLWPENFDGTYPKDCGTRPSNLTNSDWQGLFPSASLAQHEWTTHGVCTPYNADTYFGLVREARNRVQVPAALTGPSQPARDTPADITAQFARINTGVPAGGIVLSCGNNYLTAVEFCFDKNINPIACQGLRACRANSVKIASAGGGANQ